MRREALGKYRIKRSLGKGGFGEVFEGEHPTLKSLRALKVPSNQGEEFEKEIREAVLQARLDHPNIIQIYDVERKGGTLFIVMQYADGGNLRNRLKTEGKLSIEQALKYGIQICRAIQFAHGKSIIHRDIKPENILVTKDNRVLVTDFGLAKVIRDSQDKHSRVAGTVNYMAPEHLDGKAGFQSDLWSMGAILYEMVTGRLCFSGDTEWQIMSKIKSGEFEPPRRIDPEIPEELERIVLRLLKDNLKERYPDADELLADLSEFQRTWREKQEIPTDEVALRCPNCGLKVPIGENICGTCGTVLTQGEGEIPPSQKATRKVLEWPMFRGNPQRTACSSAGLRLPLREKWRYEIGRKIYSSPACAKECIVVGASDTCIYCLDARIGALQWSFQTDNTVYSSPAIYGGIVYIGSYDHHLYAIELDTGKLVWKHPCGGAISSSPIICDEKVLVGGYDGYLYVIDVNDGNILWKFKTGGVIESSPVVYDGVVCFGSQDSYLYAVDLNDQKERWKFRAEHWVESSPCLGKGLVFFGSYDGCIYALDLNTGNLKWQHKTDDWVYSSPAYEGGRVYVGSHDRFFYALDGETGKCLWKFETRGPIQSSPCLTNDLVFFGSLDGNLYALDTKKGHVEWKTDLGHEIASSPCIFNGTLFVGCSDGNLYAFE